MGQIHHWSQSIVVHEHAKPLHGLGWTHIKLLLTLFAMFNRCSADDQSMIFFLTFSQKKADHANYIQETICMNGQILFSGKNKIKYSKMSSVEFFTQHTTH